MAFLQPLFAHCFCQMSTMYSRQTGTWCGPGIRCGDLGKSLEEVQRPPADEGKWIDGHNTFIETGDRQGLVHRENYDALFNVQNIDQESPPPAE